MEQVFSIPTLGLRDATANDPSDSFDYQQTPLPPLMLSTHSCPVVNNTSQFGEQLLNTSITNTVKVFNPNTTALKVSSTTVSAGDFKISGCSGSSVKPGDTCSLKITFVPTVLGPRSAAITITDSDSSSPQTVTATGTGSAVKLSMLRVNFTQPQVVGTTATMAYTITNTDTKALAIPSISEVGEDFIQTNTCPATLAPSANCKVTVKFTPLATGPRWGQITIADSDPGSPHQVRLVGTGIKAGGPPAARLPDQEQPTHMDEDDIEAAKADDKD